MLTKRRHTSPFVMFFVKSIHRTSPHRYTITTTTTIKITQPSEKELHTTHLRCPALNGKNCDLISASPYSIKSVSSCIITIQPLKRLPMSLDCFHSILNISVSLCILCCTDVVTFLLLSFYTYTIQRLSFFSYLYLIKLMCDTNCVICCERKNQLIIFVALQLTNIYSENTRKVVLKCRLNKMQTMLVLMNRTLNYCVKVVVLHCTSVTGILIGRIRYNKKKIICTDFISLDVT